MIDPLVSPFTDAFSDFRQSVNTSCFLCSPYITQSPIRALVQSLQERQLVDTVQVRVLTDLSLLNLVQGSTDPGALLYLYDHLPNVQVSYLPRVHAKVYIADNALAIVGSANFTDGGTFRNYEYGLRVDDTLLVRRIQDDLQSYASLGGEATPLRLRELQEQVLPLKETAREARKMLRQAMPLKEKQQQTQAEDTLIRIRVQGRSLNAIFSDTILFLLARGPMPTQELNTHIQSLHPDLCDDTIDRVIDSVHYGKRWKHGVRGAQVTLARQGLAAYNKQTRLWRLT